MTSMWSGNLFELMPFLINNLAPTIKVSWEFSNENITILDMVICKDQDNPSKLVTLPYQKHPF